MTAADQTIINMLMQINNNLVRLTLLLQKMDRLGINVRTQESHRP